MFLQGRIKMLKNRFRVITILSILLLFCFQLASSQHFVKMNDRQWIELAVDMIRKGVQQQDTLKIAMVSAPSVLAKQQSLVVDGVLTRKFQDIFNNSSKRKLSLPKPLFNQPNPLGSSSFWDFDIVNIKIKITGDSAVVDCELVLWGASPLAGSKETGRRVQEKFIFKSPSRILSSAPANEEGGTFNNKGARPNRTWQLVRFEKLLDFINLTIENFVDDKQK
jgi:hypothetical protein